MINGDGGRLDKRRDLSHVVAMAAGSARSYPTLMNVTDHLNGHGKTLWSGFSSSHSCDFDASERDRGSVGEHSGSAPLTGLITHSCGGLRRFGSLFKDS